jgi:hypothetical protein
MKLMSCEKLRLTCQISNVGDMKYLAWLHSICDWCYTSWTGQYSGFYHTKKSGYSLAYSDSR